MPFSLTWLPDVLKAAGLRVATVPGWEKRGRAEMGAVLGVICHHTGDSRNGNMPSLDTLIGGRSDLPGPLAQLGLARDGTFYVIAAGRCNHAGEGHWMGLVNGNANFIGIEAENKGTKADVWPAVQLEAYYQGVAAILKHVGRGSEFCVGHKEWAKDRKKNKKDDPHDVDMADFRAKVAVLLNSGLPPLKPIPKQEPPHDDGRPSRPTLRRGDDHPLAETLQELLGIFPTNTHFGPRTEAAVREFQRAHGMVPDGIVGPKTWLALDVRAQAQKDAGGAPALPLTAAASGASAPADGALAWGAKVTPAFKQRVRQISAKLGCDANDLMSCMAFESGETFSPSARNAQSGATGLIQFMPSTAEGLGTTTEKLAAMTAVAQLDFVERYFSGFHGLRTLEDLYMAILWPRAVGKPDDFVLFAAPTKAYQQNQGLDKDKDGKVTKREAASAVRQRLVKGLGAGFLG
jgi:peptidoglycan hydrolase-like protein with peptidoglycan-binding domain